MTTPTSFRLDPDQLRDLDELAAILTEELGQMIGRPTIDYTRTMALTYAIGNCLDRKREAKRLVDDARVR